LSTQKAPQPSGGGFFMYNIFMIELTSTSTCVNQGTSYCLEWETVEPYLGIHAQQVNYITGLFLFFLAAILVMYAFRNQ
jgi:hypothetical protein